MELKAGQRITAPFLPAPAEVKKFETRAGYFLLEVVLDDDHHTYKPLRIIDDQLAQIQVLGGSPVAHFRMDEDSFVTGFDRAEGEVARGGGLVTRMRTQSV
jgi:hypothetical protein